MSRRVFWFQNEPSICLYRTQQTQEYYFFFRMEPVETVVAVAFGVLAAVFLATLGTLFIICYCRLSTKHSKLYNVSEFRYKDVRVYVFIYLCFIYRYRFYILL